MKAFIDELMAIVPFWIAALTFLAAVSVALRDEDDKNDRQ